MFIIWHYKNTQIVCIEHNIYKKAAINIEMGDSNNSAKFTLDHDELFWGHWPLPGLPANIRLCRCDIWPVAVLAPVPLDPGRGGV